MDRAINKGMISRGYNDTLQLPCLIIIDWQEADIFVDVITLILISNFELRNLIEYYIAARGICKNV